MNEMVERVARALIDDDPTMFGYHESHIKAKESAARAAIAAMREPTGEMIEAGGDYLHACEDYRWAPEQVWQAMHAALLAGAKETETK